MDRKEFLLKAGVATGSLAFFGNACKCFAQDAAKKLQGTPCEKKQEFTEAWVKRFFDLIDQNVDEKTRKKLMRANGKGCYQNSRGEEKINPVSVDDFVKALQKYAGDENCRREGDTIYFNYKITDGKCLCPMVESGPPGLSGTYCECSAGYVQSMFEIRTGKTVQVELLESLKRSGKGCKFKIQLV